MKLEIENEENSEIQENILYAESIFGAKTKRGLVRLSYGITFDVVVSPEEARFFAMTILEAATAAEMDEILMSWMQTKIGIPNERAAAGVLADFRKIREDLRRRELEEARKAGTENKL